MKGHRCGNRGYVHLCSGISKGRRTQRGVSILINNKWKKKRE